MADVFVLRHEDDDDDELEPRPALPCSDLGDDNEADDDSHVPATAEEYLRMVRRQARKVPDVVYRPLEKSQIKAPTVRLDYEDIATCDEQLLPDIAWEKTFISKFISLRDRVQQLRCSKRPQPCKLPSTKNPKAWTSFCSGEGAVAPSLGILVQMDASTKNQVLWILVNYIQNNMESGVTPPLDPYAECWLFALLVVIDKPADPDTGAALRSLLRCLCSLRTQISSKEDPPLPALNILISILGAFYGQMPAREDSTSLDAAGFHEEVWEQPADDGEEEQEYEYEEEEGDEEGDEEHDPDTVET